MKDIETRHFKSRPVYKARAGLRTGYFVADTIEEGLALASEWSAGLEYGPKIDAIERANDLLQPRRVPMERR